MEGGDGKEGPESECWKEKGHVVSGEQGSDVQCLSARKTATSLCMNIGFCIPASGSHVPLKRYMFQVADGIFM